MAKMTTEDEKELKARLPRLARRDGLSTTLSTRQTTWVATMEGSSAAYSFPREDVESDGNMFLAMETQPDTLMSSSKADSVTSSLPTISKLSMRVLPSPKT